jgi:hypothetical protein
VWVCVYLFVGSQLCEHTGMYVHSSAHTQVFLCMCLSMCMYTSVCMCFSACTHVYCLYTGVHMDV